LVRFEVPGDANAATSSEGTRGLYSLWPVTAAVLLIVALRTVWSWRYFGGLLHDHGWYLRVVERVAEGESLYREVAWAYGPLPAQALGALVRLFPRSVASITLSNGVLAAAAVCVTFPIVRSLAGRRVAAMTAVGCCLGGAGSGLISFHLLNYTTTVAWGSALSLLTLLMGVTWIRGRSVVWFFAGVGLSVLTVLSKPEYGLAAACAIVAAAFVRRPARWLQIAVLAVAAVLGLFLVVRLGDLGVVWWRGYSGYDQIAVGAVPVISPRRVVGSNLLAGAVASYLWLKGWRRVLACPLLGAIGLAALEPLLLRGTLIQAGTFVGLSALAGILPVLLWVGWKARSRAGLGAFWVVWVFAVVLSFRWAALGLFPPAALGPAVALFAASVDLELLRLPTRPGLLVLIGLLVLSSVETELKSLVGPGSAVEVETSLGPVRTDRRFSATIDTVSGELTRLPAGPLFVSGWGPGWYLVSGRENVTRFDGLLEGLGSTGVEARELLERIRAEPPEVILLDRHLQPSRDYSHEILFAAVGVPYASVLTDPAGRWEVFARLRPPERPVESPAE
jgi:hypothetical protein